MSDLIKREDAIWWVKTECNPYGKPTLDFESGKKVIEHLEHMPSADRPQGEWETTGKNHPYKRCPFCKRVRAFTDTRFCDWCGARMKGADDE